VSQPSGVGGGEILSKRARSLKRVMILLFCDLGATQQPTTTKKKNPTKTNTKKKGSNSCNGPTGLVWNQFRVTDSQQLQVTLATLVGVNKVTSGFIRNAGSVV